MKTTKKIFSLVMAVVMLVCIVPLGASAAETNRMYCSKCTKIVTTIKSAPVLPTCESNGYTEILCTDCYGVIYIDDVVDPLGHNIKIQNGKSATCTKDGYVYSYACTKCTYRESYNEPQILKATGHVLGEWIRPEVVACNAPGIAYRYCSKCDYYEAETVYGEHKTGETIIVVEPTCTQEGQEKTICYYCNNALAYSVIKPLGHNLKLVKSYKAPTCKNEGNYGEQYCNRCKETFYFDAYGNNLSKEYITSNPLNALGHIDNNNDYICDRCLAMLEMPDPEQPEYKIENGYYYIVENGTATVLGVDLETKGKIVIPSTLGGYSVTAIGEYAFSECFWLTDIVIPDTVKTIGEGAFCYCIALKEIVIPKGVISIGDYAFACCISLERLIVKNDNAIIGNYIGFSDMIVKAGHTSEEWVNKFYAIIDAELNGEVADSLYNEIMAITDIYDKLVVNPYLTIYGYEPSTAKSFAITSGVNFKNISEYYKKDVDIATGVEVKYPEHAFDTEVELVVKENGANANVVLGSLFTKYASYDISFEADGNKVQPNGKVTVKLPIPDGYEKGFVFVYYIDDIGGKTLLNSKVVDDYILFETDHFSEYVIVDESSKIEKPSEPETPDEPDVPCACKCHGNFIQRLIFKITNFFQKLFGKNKVCACGVKH